MEYSELPNIPNYPGLPEGSDTGRNLVHSTGNHRNQKSTSLAKMGVFYRLRMRIANKSSICGRVLPTAHAHY